MALTVLILCVCLCVHKSTCVHSCLNHNHKCFFLTCPQCRFIFPFRPVYVIEMQTDVTIVELWLSIAVTTVGFISMSFRSQTEHMSIILKMNSLTMIMILCLADPECGDVPLLTPGSKEMMSQALKATFSGFTKEQQRLGIPKGETVCCLSPY